MGRIAIITGGTRGIRAAIARRLKESGHSVAAVYLALRSRVRWTRFAGASIVRIDLRQNATTRMLHKEERS